MGRKKNKEIKLIPINPYPIPKINKAMLVHWEEHCLECAPPNCYNTCPLYEVSMNTLVNKIIKSKKINEK